MDETLQAVRAAMGRSAERGIALPDGSFAWSCSQSLEIIRSMEPSKVAIVEGEFFKAEPIGLVPAYAGWTCERAQGETATDFVMRSRDVAAREICRVSAEGLHVVLQFSAQEDAA